MTVSLSQGGMGLGTAWGKQVAERMLKNAGFAVVETKEIEGDIFHAYYIATKR